VLALALALFAIPTAATASASRATRTLRYAGYVVTIPRSWPVYYLSSRPHTCVRFDRHALYLGTPGSTQRCPAHVAGRTDAILIEPLPANAHAPRGATAGAREATPLPGAERHATTYRASHVLVTATWANDEAAVARALHRRSLPVAPRPRARSSKAVRAHSASAIYTGLGFDACSAPSESQMTAWGSSPYRAIGVYIGGVNEACSQPNLTSTWVTDEIASGWHLIPTYVGLQAPNNDCNCAPITPSQAAAEGAAAANDAASDAAAIGIPAGNPIYDDMEGYSRTSTNSQTVLAFLSAWTSQLHADGYASGVYSSGASGITDLVNQQGTGYVEPDDIWIADWNDQQTTSDPYVPSSDWSNQQRLHQYHGGHNETYGGVTINIDNDYLDGATADTSTGSVTSEQQPATPPSLAFTPLPNGTAYINASWPGAIGVSAWRVLAGLTNSTSVPFATIAHGAAKGAVTQIAVRNASPYFEVQALNSGGQVLGTSPPTPMPAHVALFGPSTFAPAKGGLGAIPAGCYTGQGCHVTLTLRAGRTLVARTGSEYIGSGTGGLLYYRLTPRGRTLLARARGNRLPVKATVRDVSGATATIKVNVIATPTAGRAPSHRLVHSPTVRLVNAFDYVSSRGVGGILATCQNTALCQISTTLKVGNVVIARTGPEYLGANELGYLIFSLTSRGRALLRSARGNQLGAQLTLTNAGVSATTRIVLVSFT
jgi:hypothetical protein